MWDKCLEEIQKSVSIREQNEGPSAFVSGFEVASTLPLQARIVTLLHFDTNIMQFDAVLSAT